MPVRNHIPIKQGIVTVLGANSGGGSIRKTLSADMSSKKWLDQNGFFSPIKNNVFSSEEDGVNPNQDQDEVWRSIQSQKESKKPAQNGVWSSILTQKSDNSPPPYVFTPVKRTASSMSEKSLEICTESLGSETGSDCFSCFDAEEGMSHGDEEEREDRRRSEEEEVRSEHPSTDLHVVKYKESPVRTFPPPLPSISGGNGPSASLRLRSFRQNGRFILQAVPVPSRNYSHAKREDGRLVLTLIHGPTVEEEKFEMVDRGGHEVEEGGSGGDKQEFVEEEEENLSLPTGMIRVHKTGLLMKKLMVARNINPKWSNKFSNDEQKSPIPQPLPPVVRLIGSPPSTSFNAYDYFWRSKATIYPMMMTNKNINQDLEETKSSKREKIVPCMRRCKEAKKSLIWEPYCIATS